jgi:ribonuclease HI
MTYQYTLVFDGGSKGNPGKTFGSYRIQQAGQRPQTPIRLSFGVGTNNEAEYRALIAGLQALLGQLEAQGRAAEDVHLVIRGDSRLVLSQVGGAWKAKNPRMRALRDEAQHLISSFRETEFIHQDRGRSVAILGH